MEATFLGPHRFNPCLCRTKLSNNQGRQAKHVVWSRYSTCAGSHVLIKMKVSEPRKNCFELSNGHLVFKKRDNFSLYCSDQLERDHQNVVTTSADCLANENGLPGPSSAYLHDKHDVKYSDPVQYKPTMFRNRYLNFVRIGSVLDGAAESFFKSEIRRRLFVTAVLIAISRVGYFIPLPGFDRRLIPTDYLSFVSGSVDELGDSTPELKLSLFQLGISPQIGASIIMQVLCHVVPSLVKLRKEGLDGHEKIKSYMCV